MNQPDRAELQRFRYEGGDLDYEPRHSAPEDWDGNLSDLIGDYVSVDALTDLGLARELRYVLGVQPFDTSDGSDDPNRVALITALDLFVTDREAVR